MSEIIVNDIRISYDRTGHGKPLLLLHGNGEDRSIFEEAVEELKGHFTCYTLDTRGHGSSEPVEEYHYKDMAEDVVAFLEMEDLTNAAVYGFSDGGIIGLLAAMKTDRIKDLIVSGANIHPFGVQLHVLLDMKKEYRKTKNPLLQLMICEPDITGDDLKMIKAKTLVLAGEHDLIRTGHTKKLAKAIPGSTLRIVRGEDHGSYIVHSRKIGILLKKWLLRKPKGRRESDGSKTND